MCFTENQLIDISDAAEILGISRTTLVRWSKEGYIRTFRTTGSDKKLGRRKYLIKDVLELRARLKRREERLQRKKAT